MAFGILVEKSLGLFDGIVIFLLPDGIVDGPEDRLAGHGDWRHRGTDKRICGGGAATARLCESVNRRDQFSRVTATVSVPKSRSFSSHVKATEINFQCMLMGVWKEKVTVWQRRCSVMALLRKEA